jgi:hypothetical protein
MAEHMQQVRFDGKSERDILIELYVKLDNACFQLEKHENLLDRLFTRAEKNASGVNWLRAMIGAVWSVIVLITGAILAHVIGGSS